MQLGKYCFYVCLLLGFTSCNKKWFVEKSRVIKEEKGFLINYSNLDTDYRFIPAKNVIKASTILDDNLKLKTGFYLSNKNKCKELIFLQNNPKKYSVTPLKENIPMRHKIDLYVQPVKLLYVDGLQYNKDVETHIFLLEGEQLSLEYQKKNVTVFSIKEL